MRMELPCDRKVRDFARLNGPEKFPGLSKNGPQGRKRPGGETGSPLGPMCGAEKDWHERSFRAFGEINGCQKITFGEPAGESKSVGPGVFKSLADVVLGSPEFNFSPATGLSPTSWVS